jgi:hypothetical protein
MIPFLGPLEGGEPSAIDLRAEVIAEHLSKRQGIATSDAGEQPSVTLLNELHELGHLRMEPAKTGPPGSLELSYVPSARLIELLLDEDPRVVKALGSKTRRSVRSTKGAIISLPAEDRQTSVDVFTTDWSPCASACALAVHPLHPFVADCPNLSLIGSRFTGRHVRHPLTGDLLPVWVADWVKAGFGTGAVLVNPAHDATDLAFAREVGLPVRFSLVPDGASDEPETWPTPPVIKTGQVVRAGPQYDGIGHEAAQQTYLEVLRARELARQSTDRSLHPIPIARLHPDASGPFAVRTDGRLLEPGGRHTPERVDVEFSAVYRCADSALRTQAHTVVANVTSMKKVGPALVGMLVDVEQDPTDFVVSGPAECSVQDISRKTLKTALLVGGATSEPVLVNRQLVDQVERFQASWHRCREELAGGSAQPPEDVLSFLDQGNPKKAFQTLTRWQKDCLKSGRSVDTRALDTVCELFIPRDPSTT